MVKNRIYKLSLYFLCFLFIFILNTLTDIIYYKALSLETHSLFLYLKIIEISIFAAFFLLVFYCFHSKKCLNFSEKSMNYLTMAFSILLLIFYCECEFCEILDIDENIIWNFSFIIGIFIITSIQLIKNPKLKLVSFLLEMIYFTVRFHYFNGLRIEKNLILASSIIFYIICKEIIKKNELNNEKERTQKGKCLKDSRLMRVLKEFNEKGIAIFDSKCNSLFINEKLVSLLKNSEDGSSKALLNLHLNFSYLKFKFAFPKSAKERMNQIKNSKKIDQNFIQEFFNNHKEISLEAVLSELKNLLVSIDSEIETIHLTFNLEGREQIIIKEEFYTPKLHLSLLMQARKVPIFLIEIQFVFDQDAFLAKEKKNQNDKIYFVSHEMRTPLNCIVSMLQILKPSVEGNLVEEFITPAMVSCNFLLFLVEDLLDMAQIESNKFTMNYEEFDIRMLISEIIELFKIQVTSKNAELVRNISYNIPETLVSDHRRIRQILINLIGNSLKFLKKTKGKITIEVYLNPQFSNQIHFAVKDNGIGIRDENKNKLFTAFGKINNDENKKMNSNGVGLGLMISNSLAMNLNPTKYSGLKVESEYGFGTTFSFVIEDKNEISNVPDFLTERNLQDNYQLLMKQKEEEKTKFFGSWRFRPNNHLKTQDSIQSSTNKKTFSSFKIMADARRNKMHNEIGSFESKPDDSFKDSPLQKQSMIGMRKTSSIDQMDDSIISRGKYLKKGKTFFENKKLVAFSTPLQSFCDIFICKKDSEQLEAIENKTDCIKELILSKSCKCSEILICDDNAFNIYSLKKQLESFNFKIDSANDGEEAIERVSEYYNKVPKCCKAYRLIFMDIEMPGKNGYETALAINKFYELLPEKINSKIIACSAHLGEEYLGKHRVYGIEEFVTKPIIK